MPDYLRLVEIAATAVETHELTPTPEAETNTIPLSFYGDAQGLGISPVKLAEVLESDPEAMEIIRHEQGEYF